MKKVYKVGGFIITGCDSKEFVDTPQSIEGYVVMKKSPFVEMFLAKSLEYVQDSRIITKQVNTQGVINYEEYMLHRQDQSVWALMSKKYKLKRFREPSQFGMMNFCESEVEARNTFPQIIDSHRMNVGSIAEL